MKKICVHVGKQHAKNLFICLPSSWPQNIVFRGLRDNACVVFCASVRLFCLLKLHGCRLELRTRMRKLNEK